MKIPKFNPKWKIPFKEKIVIAIISITAIILIISAIALNADGDVYVPSYDYDCGYDNEYDASNSDVNNDSDVYYDDLDN